MPRGASKIGYWGLLLVLSGLIGGTGNHMMTELNGWEAIGEVWVVGGYGILAFLLIDVAIVLGDLTGSENWTVESAAGTVGMLWVAVSSLWQSIQMPNAAPADMAEMFGWLGLCLLLMAVMNSPPVRSRLNDLSLDGIVGVSS